MKRKQKKMQQDGSLNGTVPPEQSGFYTGSPMESPLYEDQKGTERFKTKKTKRHLSAFFEEKQHNSRDKLALLAIIRASTVVLSLLLALCVLWLGIKMYEQSVRNIAWQVKKVPSEAVREAASIEPFNADTEDMRQLLAERITLWKETERLTRAAGELERWNNLEQAIIRCQEALHLDPTHMEAVEQLGDLRYRKGQHREAIRVFLQLLSAAPSRKDIQKKLIRALNTDRDAEAAEFFCRWYLESYLYDTEVQRYLGDALFLQKKYAEAAETYGKVLKDTPEDTEVLEQQVRSFLVLEQYDKALQALGTLRQRDHSDERYYRQIAICNVQLKHNDKALNTFVQAAHLFGRQKVLVWMADPLIDPVREDRDFQLLSYQLNKQAFQKEQKDKEQQISLEQTKEFLPPLRIERDSLVPHLPEEE